MSEKEIFCHGCRRYKKPEAMAKIAEGSSGNHQCNVCRDKTNKQNIPPAGIIGLKAAHMEQARRNSNKKKEAKSAAYLASYLKRLGEL